VTVKTTFAELCTSSVVHRVQQSDDLSRYLVTDRGRHSEMQFEELGQYVVVTAAASISCIISGQSHWK